MLKQTRTADWALNVAPGVAYATQAARLPPLAELRRGAFPVELVPPSFQTLAGQISCPAPTYPLDPLLVAAAHVAAEVPGAPAGGREIF